MRQSSQTQRRCLACRKPLDKAAGLRFVASLEGTLTLDPRQKLPGRGASACARVECLEHASRRGSWVRALRRPVTVPDVPQLAQLAATASERSALQTLGLMQRGGRLAVGARAVGAAISEGQALAVIVLAGVFSARRARDLMHRGHTVAQFSNSETLGRAIGRPPTGALGIPAGRLADVLMAEIKKCNMLTTASARQ